MRAAGRGGAANHVSALAMGRRPTQARGPSKVSHDLQGPIGWPSPEETRRREPPACPGQDQLASIGSPFLAGQCRPLQPPPSPSLPHHPTPATLHRRAVKPAAYSAHCRQAGLASTTHHQRAPSRSRLAPCPRQPLSPSQFTASACHPLVRHLAGIAGAIELRRPALFSKTPAAFDCSRRHAV